MSAPIPKGVTWLDLDAATAQARAELGAGADSLHLLERTAALLADKARLQTPEASMTAASDEEARIAQLESEVRKLARALAEADTRVTQMSALADALREHHTEHHEKDRVHQRRCCELYAEVASLKGEVRQLRASLPRGGR